MRSDNALKRLLGQAVRFIGLSGIGWILDFSTYIVLSHICENLVLDNFISSWVGVTFVFIFATRKIFENNSRIDLKWKYLIYIVYQVLLIFLVSKLLGLIDSFIVSNISLAVVTRFSAIIAKILVTPITMILNFFVMKGLIEKL
jgi:putative flippase GtrA